MSCKASIILRKTFSISVLLYAAIAFADNPVTSVNHSSVDAPWASSSRWLYHALASKFADHKGDYQTAMKQMDGVAEQSQQYEAYQYSYALAIDTLRLNQAIKIATDWLTQFPRDNDAQLALIRAYLMDGNQTSAYQQMEAMLGTDAGPQNVAQITRLLTYLQDDEKRLNVLRKLSQQFPKNPYIYYYLGLMAKEQGEVNVAINAFEHALKLDGRWRQLELMQAEVLSSVGRLTEARSMMDKLRKRFPSDVDLLSAEIDMLVDHYQWEDALVLAKQWAKIDNQDGRIGQLIAWLYASSGKYTQAIAAYQTLLNHGDMDKDQFLFQAAQAAMTAGKREQAINYLKQVPKQSTLYMLAQQQIALTYFSPLVEAKALEAFAKLRTQFPEYALEMYLVEISHLDQQGAHQAAGEVLTQALAQFPNHVDILYADAEHKVAIGELAAAEAAYQAVLKRDPANIDALNSYGYLLLTKTQRREEAEKLIREAIKQYPDSPAVQDSYGWLLFLNHRPADALIWLQRAYAAYRKDEIAAHYVEILFANDKKALAKEVYRYELRGQPNNLYLLETGKRLELHEKS